MSLIVTELYDALIEAGASEPRARAAAAAMPDIERLATKDDITELRVATKRDIAELRAATKRDIAELRAEIVGARAESKQDNTDLRAELKLEIADLKREVAVVKLGTFTIGSAILAFLVKLTFFP